ncbi:MAG: hypothetical protein Q7R92_01510 [bacterium]|nr:hypothetical protein [bacterium]
MPQSKLLLQIALASLIATLATAAIVSAATTIGNNISTAGNLAVTSATATSTFSTGGLTVGTNQFVVQQTSGNVGIGTTTPNNLLTIYSATKAGLEFSGASGSTYKWTIGMDKSDAGKFKIASSTALGTSDRLIIDGNGNVGIATSTPAATLDVNGYMKLNKNTSQPVACGANNAGSIALNSLYAFCVCNGSSWINATSTQACVW